MHAPLDPTDLARTPPDSLLALTLDAAVRDRKTVEPDGSPTLAMCPGMQFRPAVTHTDQRGTVTEMLDQRWGWHPAAIQSAYLFTIRPGYAKGWNLHQHHEDRYFVISGEMELHLYDVRPDSPACGRLFRFVVGPHHRGIINVPAYVWHLDLNLGTTDVTVVNFPTLPYDYENPDKYRLPIDTPLIPWTPPAGLRGW